MMLSGQCQLGLDSLLDMLHEQGQRPYMAGKGPESQHRHYLALKSHSLLAGLLLLLLFVAVAGILLSRLIFGNAASNLVY